MIIKPSMFDSVIDVNTQNVRNCADTLTNINNNIEKCFSNVTKALNKLDGSWDSKASSKAISKFNKIKSDFCGETGRKAIMNNYIKFLQNAVAADYESTEQANTNLSELFK